MAVAVAAVPQGAASKWVPTPFYAAAAAAKTLVAPLPHYVNEPLVANQGFPRGSKMRIQGDGAPGTWASP